jgi:hypothetical protein
MVQNSLYQWRLAEGVDASRLAAILPDDIHPSMKAIKSGMITSGLVAHMPSTT